MRPLRPDRPSGTQSAGDDPAEVAVRRPLEPDRSAPIAVRTFRHHVPRWTSWCQVNRTVAHPLARAMASRSLSRSKSSMRVCQARPSPSTMRRHAGMATSTTSEPGLAQGGDTSTSASGTRASRSSRCSRALSSDVGTGRPSPRAARTARRPPIPGILLARQPDVALAHLAQEVTTVAGSGVEGVAEPLGVEPRRELHDHIGGRDDPDAVDHREAADGARLPDVTERAVVRGAVAGADLDRRSREPVEAVQRGRAGTGHRATGHHQRGGRALAEPGARVRREGEDLAVEQARPAPAGHPGSDLGTGRTVLDGLGTGEHPVLSSGEAVDRPIDVAIRHVDDGTGGVWHDSPKRGAPPTIRLSRLCDDQFGRIDRRRRHGSGPDAHRSGSGGCGAAAGAGSMRRTSWRGRRGCHPWWGGAASTSPWTRSGGCAPG